MAKVEERSRHRWLRYAGVGALIATAVVVAVVWLPSLVEDPEVRKRSPAEQDEPAPAVTPLPMEGPVEPGTYQARFLGGGESAPVAVLDVPAGFDAWRGTTIVERRGARQLSFWTVARVKHDPCDLSNLGQDPGPSVADLATALRVQDLTRTSRAVPTRLDGYEGLYLELTTPNRTDCPASRFDLWTTGIGSTRYTGPREVLRLWILDVDGNRLVVNTSGGTPEIERQTDALVDSVRIVVDPEA